MTSSSETICLVFLWCLGTNELANARYQLLLTVKDSSVISLVDLWYDASHPWSSSYSRDSLIDELDNATELPRLMSLVCTDVHKQNLAGIWFNYSGATTNLSSWIEDNRMTRDDFHITPVFQTVIRNNALLLASNTSDDLVYIAAGPLNGTAKNQFIGFSKTGYPFSISEGVNLTEGHQVLFVEYNQTDEGIINTTIFLGHTNGYQYVNGISILSQNTSVNFTIGYNNGWNEECNSSFMYNLTDEYMFRADGQLNILKGSLRVVCLFIWFSDVIYDYKVTLTESDKDFVLADRISISAQYPNTETTEDITTVAMETTTCYCPCTSTNKYVHLANLTHQELQVALQEETDKIKEELTVDTTQLSSTIRKKTSATDNRPSSVGIGSLGLAILIVEVLLFVVADIMRLPSCSS